MKKIYLIFTFAAATLVCVNAQFKIINQKTQGIVAGDSHQFLFTEPANSGLAGKNVTWDFSELKTNGRTLTSHMFSAMETPKGNLINGANTAIEEFGNVFYFEETANEIKHIGYVSGSTVIKYDKPLLKLKFPITLGDKFTGEYSGTQSSGSVESKFTGKYEVSCDASGKLILPNGITVYNTLRVKQSRTYNCTVGCNYSEVIYRWYSKDVHYPLFVIIENVDAKGNITSTLTAYHAISASTVSDEKESILADSDINLQYFPNPMNDKLTVKYTLTKEANVEVSIYNYAGTLVKTVVPSAQQAKGTYSYTVADDGLNAGVYFLKIKHGDKESSYKLIKAL